MLENKWQVETGIMINDERLGIVAFSMTIYCKFTVESAYERILRSFNIWRSYRQQS